MKKPTAEATISQDQFGSSEDIYYTRCKIYLIIIE